jgi:hypothetical protein
MVAVIFTGGCMPSFLSEQKKDADVIYYLEPSDIQAEITRLQTKTTEEIPAPEKAQAHLELALLHSHYKNGSPDYESALLELAKYASFDPEGADRIEIRNLQAIFRDIKLLMDENKLLMDENVRLRGRLNRLLKENEERKLTIEKLKHLDIELEERRRQVK